MNNEIGVQTALALLSGGLEKHIAKVLAPHLGGGLEWTDILQELDQMKGKAPKLYSRTDIQCQLRAITERLGNLGYPFDSGDPNRMMSTYGNELRIVRNRWAHNDQFTSFEAMRAVDTVFILLTHIGDTEGAGKAAAERAALVLGLIDEPAVEKMPDGQDGPESTEPEDLPAEGPDVPGEPVRRFARRRTEFEPWDVVVTGSVETLDNLPKKVAKESVRATIEEIVDSEGPIHRDRLTKLVGYTYGLGKVHEARAKKILSQINASACFVDQDHFVWPGDTNPADWKIHRRSPIGTTRKFLEISPHEIANAATDILRAGALSEEDLRRRTLAVFGRKKSTQALTTHFGKGLSSAIKSCKIRPGAQPATFETVS